MKKQTLCRIAIIALFLFFGRMAASAQSMEHLMTVQVPFDFQAGEKSLSAGEYIIKRDPQIPHYLLIQCPKQKISVIASTIAHSLPEEPIRTSLTFKEYGGKHFLSEVKVSRYSSAYSVIRSKDERMLAQVTKARTIRAIPNNNQTNN